MGACTAGYDYRKDYGRQPGRGGAEKEEYEYTLALTRKKDKDAYELKKAELERELKETRARQEKELAEREAALSAREKELDELRKKVETFQATIYDAVKKVAQEATKAAEKKAELDAKIIAKDVEGERNLLKLEIKTLQESVKRQESEIQALRKELADANRQVMTIATQAIEGASGSKTLSTVQEIAMEQAKLVKSQK